MGDNRRVYHEDYDQYKFPIEGDDDMGSERNQSMSFGDAIFLMMKYCILPCVVYAVMNAMIVCGIYLLFGSYWSLDIGITELFGFDLSDYPCFLLMDLWITTVFECIFIIFVIAFLVNKDLKKKKVFSLKAGHKFIKFRIIRIMRNGLDFCRKVSFCRRCGRMMVSMFIFVLFALIIFFVPIAILLCIFVNVKGWVLLKMIVFKAAYGGMIALFLSPITTFLMLL